MYELNQTDNTFEMSNIMDIVPTIHTCSKFKWKMERFLVALEALEKQEFVWEVSHSTELYTQNFL